eukprot:8840304-Lingulodinium_polyedra.AAC.1
MIASDGRGSQINGGRMFFPARARCSFGPPPVARVLPLHGTVEQERLYFGEQPKAMVDDGVQPVGLNYYPS